MLTKKFCMNGALEALCYIMLTGTILSEFSNFFWVLELATHFRIQYILLLVSALIFFSFIKKWKTFGVFLFALLLNCYYVVPDFSPASIPHPQTSTLQIMTYNVFLRNEKYQEVLDFLQNSECDIIVLEEVTFAWKQQFHKLKDAYPYQKGVSREDSFGIWLLSKKPFISSEITYFGMDYGVPSIKAEFEHEQEKFIVIGTHPLPPVSKQYSEERNEHLKKLADYISQQNQPVVVAGDFNTTPWSPYFMKFNKDSGLQDTRNGYGIQSTWPSTFMLFWIPIDHCFVSNNISIHSRYVLSSSYGSDHFPVVIKFSLTKKN